MLKLFEILTGVGAALAALLLFTAFAGGMSAPQQGAAAAIALGMVVTPYCVLAMLQRKRLLERGRNSNLAELDF